MMKSSAFPALLIFTLPATLLATLLAGCAGGADRSLNAPCPPASICDSQPPAGLSLAGELIPPAESGFARVEFAEVRFDSSWLARLAAPARVLVRGQVVDEKMQPISALVAATRASRIPGLPAITRTVTTGPNGFHIELGEGAYEVHVLPQGAAQALYPPESVAVEVKGPGGQGQGSTPLVVVPLSRRELLSGVVQPAAGPSLAGVKVRVVDAGTRELVSSVVTTDARGAFTLALSSDVRKKEALLLLADGGPLPVTLQRKLDPKTSLAMPQVDLHAPALPARATYVIPLLGRSPSGAEMPLTSARVEARGDLSEPGSLTRALLQTSIITGVDGRAELSLVPGAEANRSYTVTVTPPADSIFATGAFEIATGPVGGQLARTILDVRPALVGQLLGPDGEPVRGAIIAAQPAASAHDPDAAELQLPQVITDSKDGRFLMRLQVGRYDLQITPPFGSQLPTWSQSDVILSGDADLGPLTLPPGAAARVEIVSAGGGTIAGAELRLYADADIRCSDRASCRAPRLRANSTAGGDGVARVVLAIP